VEAVKVEAYNLGVITRVVIVGSCDDRIQISGLCTGKGTDKHIRFDGEHY